MIGQSFGTLNRLIQVTHYFSI